MHISGQTIQGYNGPVQPGPPPPPPPPPTTVMNTVFNQLKWSVLDPPSEVEIFGLDAEDKPQWTPLTEAIANSPATTPSHSHLRVRLEPLHTWEHWQQSEQEPPERLLIQNFEHQPVSVRQFLQAVHDYAVPLRQLLCRCCDIYDPEEEPNVRFYFSLVQGVREGTPDNPFPEVVLHVIEDTDEDGHSLEYHLTFLETMYRKRHASA